MKKINLAVTGCLGRMGQQIVRSSKSAENFKLVSITENRKVNKKVFGLKPELNSESAFKKANVIIDFTVPKCTLEVLKIASKLKKRVVIGTTGFLGSLAVQDGHHTMGENCGPVILGYLPCMIGFPGPVFARF